MELKGVYEGDFIRNNLKIRQCVLKSETGKIVPNRQEALVSRRLLEHQSWFYGSVCFEHITIVFRSASVLLNLVVGVPFSVDMVAAPIISSLDALHSLYRHPYFLLNYLLCLWLLSFTPLYPVLFSEVYVLKNPRVHPISFSGGLIQFHGSKHCICVATEFISSGLTLLLSSRLISTSLDIQR